MVRPNDRKVLRDLAKQIAEISQSPQQAEKKRRWLVHNSLKPGLPMVLAFPEGGWRELLPESEYCADPSLRWMETHLRMTLFTHQVIQDDQICDAFFNVPLVIVNNYWGMEVPRVRTEELGSYRWDPPLKHLSDIKKLKPLTLAVDEEKTRTWLETARDILGDILPVRLRRGGLVWPVSVADAAAYFRGLDRLMMDMVEHPSWVHELMGFLCQTRLKSLRELESSGWLTLNNENDYVGSGGVGYTDELPRVGFVPGKVRLKDRWGFAEAQTLVGISPEMLDAFFISHILPEMECYGLNCYGCCEPLHDRLDVVTKIPRLRRISISPWADLEKSARYLEGRYVFSWKPNPAPLAADRMDEEEVRRSLAAGLRILKEHGCVVEIVMKDTHTFRGDVTRISRWVRIARQAVEDVWK